MARLRVLIVAQPRLYRQGLTLSLGEEEDIEVVGGAADAASARVRIAALRPDVVLVDMSLAGGSPMLLSIVQADDASRVVALGIAEDVASVIACLEAGAAGYVPPSGSVSDLGHCIRIAARGEIACSPALVAALAHRVASLAAELRAEHPIPRLTAREAQVLELIDRGLSNKEIGRHLCIEVPTVKRHVHNILAKLEVTRRGEAAARARRHVLGVSPAVR